MSNWLERVLLFCVMGLWLEEPVLSNGSYQKEEKQKENRWKTDNDEAKRSPKAKLAGHYEFVGRQTMQSEYIRAVGNGG